MVEHGEEDVPSWVELLFMLVDSAAGPQIELPSLLTEGAESLPCSLIFPLTG